MRYEGKVHVPWSRTEVTAVREAMEVTPLFAGRAELRALLRRWLRSHRGRGIALDVVLAEHLAANLVPLDLQTAVAKSKLHRVLQDAERRVDDRHAVEAA